MKVPVKENKKSSNLIKYLIFVFFVPLFLFFGSLFYGKFILPVATKNTMCIQMVSNSCFLGTSICMEFPNPCFIPPLWFPKNKDYLESKGPDLEIF